MAAKKSGAQVLESAVAKVDGARGKELSLSVIKAANVLKVIGESVNGCSFTEVHQATRLGATVCHRLLSTLEHERLIERDADTGRYLLGIGILTLARHVKGHNHLIRETADFLERVCQFTGDSVTLMVKDMDDVVCIERKDGSFPVRAVGTQVGTRLPMYCGAAPMAILSFLPDEEIHRYLAAGPFKKLTQKTLTQPRQILELIGQTRQRGYAIGNGDLFEYVVGIGVPVFHPNGAILGAISVGGVEQRYPPERIEEVGSWLTSEVAKVFPH